MYAFGTAILRLVMPEYMLYLYCDCNAALAVNRLKTASVCNGVCQVNTPVIPSTLCELGEIC
jgi:hypothetical protein